MLEKFAKGVDFPSQSCPIFPPLMAGYVAPVPLTISKDQKDHDEMMTMMMIVMVTVMMMMVFMMTEIAESKEPKRHY